MRRSRIVEHRRSRAVGIAWRCMNALAKAFELSSSRRRLGRPEDAQAAGAKDVDRAGGERRFRADDGEVDLLGEREVGELGRGR